MPRPRAERPTYSLAKRPMPGGAIRYYVQWWEDGAARRVSCRTGQLAAARRFLAEFEAGRGTPVAPLAPTVGAILDGYQAERETKPVSPTLGYNVAHLKAVLAGLPGVTPHVLRHTAATWMAQAGVSLVQIAGYLGNSAATVERVYAHHHPSHMAEASAALG